MNKQEFINALKNGNGLPNGIFSKIVNGAGQISVENIKRFTN